MTTLLLRQLIFALSIALISGCSTLMRSEFEASQASVPEHWLGETVSANHTIEIDSWWKQFNNPELDALITRALATNNDLALATFTLRKARLQAGLSQNERLPELALSSSRSRKFSENSTTNSFDLDTSVSYELDLWGKVSASADAKEWAAMASFEDRESTAQSLVFTVASLYWKLGYLNHRLVLSKQNSEGMDQIVNLTQNQYDSGAATRLSVLEARQSLLSQQVSHSQLLQQRTETINALALLFNQPPQDLLLSIDRLPEDALPEIAPGVPSELLIRRPDIRASLYQLKSALASKDAVALGYFPTLTLTGSTGFESSELQELLKNPVGTLGAGLVLPFIEWNKMKINKQISEVDYQTAIINYRKTLYEAFEDVANNLSARKHYSYQGEKLQARYESAKEIERIYQSKYNYGAINILDWLNAIETRRDVEASLIENRYDQYVTQARLYQALGGSDIAPDIE